LRRKNLDPQEGFIVNVLAVTEHKHVAAIIGGAVAGSAAAQVLADAGVLCVVFEQNDRPYGKIEDGLPRWHVKQRRLEYERIDSRLDNPNVFYVPHTRIGPDIDFQTLRNWGFSVIVLANGAWKDRPIDVKGIEQYVNNGLVLQNSFIYWFNHKEEKAYSGPRYEIRGGTIVVGGGLASIDVVKAVQVELYEAALRARGVDTNMLALEHKGIPEICAANKIDPNDLAVEDVVLYYRRRDIDMPLANPHDGSEEALEKARLVRRKILSRVMEKYRVRFKERQLPVGLITDGPRLAGLRFAETQIVGNKVSVVPGNERDVRAPMVISSVGSIPEPIPGVEMKGEYYRFKDEDTGEYTPAEGVYGLGNVVTGKGNIDVSRKHAASVSQHILESYLGVGEGDRDISPVFEQKEAEVRRRMNDVGAYLRRKEPLAAAQVNTILGHVRERWKQIGYTSYRDFIKAVTPPDLQ
jgi:NADPH-dependent glutamate synthase beta subunit-like oxidoreductase